jgi:hypothetical protein
MAMFFRSKYIKLSRNTYYFSFLFYVLLISEWKAAFATPPTLYKEVNQKKIEGVLTLEQYEYITELLSSPQGLENVCIELQKMPISISAVQDFCAPYPKESQIIYPLKIKTTHRWIPEKNQQEHLFSLSLYKIFSDSQSRSFSTHSTFQANKLIQYQLAMQFSQLQVKIGKVKPLIEAPFLRGRSFWTHQTTLPRHQGLLSPNTPYLNGISLSYQKTPSGKKHQNWKMTWWSTYNQNQLQNNNKLHAYLHGIQVQHNSLLWKVHMQSILQQHLLSKPKECSDCENISDIFLWLQSLYVKERIWNTLEFRTGWTLQSSLVKRNAYPGFGWVRWRSHTFPIETTLYQTSSTWHNPLMGTFSRSSSSTPQGITIHGSNEGSLHTKLTGSKVKATLLYHWVRQGSHTYSLFTRHRIQWQKITLPFHTSSLFDATYTHIRSDSTQYWSTRLKHQHAFTHSKVHSAITLKSSSYSGSHPFPIYIKWSLLLPKKKKFSSAFLPKTSIKWNSADLIAPFKIWDIQIWQSWSLSRRPKMSLQSYLELPFQRRELQTDLFYKLHFIWHI